MRYYHNKLSAKERGALRSHLRGHLNIEQCQAVEAVIAEALFFHRHLPPPELTSSPASARKAAAGRAAIVKHMKAIEEAMIEDGVPGGLLGDPDIDAFFRMWERIAAAADMEANELARYGSRRGAPPTKKWRESLIARVYAAYPAGTAKKSRASAFERTIEIALDLADPDNPVDDVHDLIVDALAHR